MASVSQRHALESPTRYQENPIVDGVFFFVETPRCPFGAAAKAAPGMTNKIKTAADSAARNRRFKGMKLDSGY